MRSSISSTTRRDLAFPALVFGAAFLAFLPALSGGWVNWDDDIFILANPWVRSFRPENLRWMLTTFHSGSYMPLTWLSFAADHALWGLRASGFHFTNLLLHAANAVLFYLVSLRLLEAAGGDRERSDLRPWAALAALLFALHPLRVESVAWIAERKDVLSGFFYLLALLAYLRRPPWTGAALACFGLSLLAKPVAVSLPIALTILDYYPLRRVSAKTWKEKIPFWALGLGFGLLGAATQASHSNMRALKDYGLLERCAQAFYGLWFYVWKTLLPLDLSPLYELPPHVPWASPPFLLSALAVAGITLILLRRRRKWPAGLAAWAFYAVTISPMLGLVQFGPQIVALHYSYLACLSWPLLAAAALRRAKGPWPAVAAAAAVLACSVLTWKQAFVWRDSMSLWGETLWIDPDNWTARHNLGLAFAERGRFDEAGLQFREAVRLKPGGADDWNNLGLALTAQGFAEDGLRAYREALLRDPGHPYAHNNLGLALMSAGRSREAVEHFSAALIAKPSFAQAQNNWGVALSRLGRRADAAEHFRLALGIDEGYSEARRNLLQVEPGKSR